MHRDGYKFKYFNYHSIDNLLHQNSFFFVHNVLVDALEKIRFRNGDMSRFIAGRGWKLILRLQQ